MRWEDMKSNSGDSNRFCEQCAKHIVDHNNSENIPTESHCARTPLSNIDRINHRSYLSATALSSIALLSFMGMNEDAVAQIQEETNRIEQGVESMKGKVQLEGRVRDAKTKEALPFVNVRVIHKHETITGTNSDFDGKFKRSIDVEKHPISEVEVIFSFVGYKRDTVKALNLSDDVLVERAMIDLATSLKTIEMSSAGVQMLGMVISIPIEEDVEQSIPKEEEEKPKVELETSDPILFPNPVSDILNVDLMREVKEPFDVLVFDLKGVLVSKHRIQGTQHFEIDCSSLQARSYELFTIQDKREEFLGKFIKVVK